MVDPTVRTRVAAWIAFCCLGFPSQDASRQTGDAPGSPAAEAIVGLWGTEQVLGPVVRGDLTIDARESEWRARIAGLDAPVRRNKNAITFALSGRGEFRGQLSADLKTIRGHWVQPPGVIYNNPYASPVKLSEAAPSVWKGYVVPLDERISFYISVERAPDGTLTAFVRNPEFNWFGRRSYVVESNGSTVVLSRAAERLEGTYDAKKDLLSIPLINSYPALQLTRRKEKNAAGFYPRVQADAGRYFYRRPVAEGDGWATASLAEVGLNPRPVSALIEKILAADPLTNPLYIQDLLVARHGKLVLEEYFYGFDQDRLHDMRSASKTFATVLVGIARDHGATLGPDTPVYSLFPEYRPFSNWDERKGRLTVQNLMTMTSGYACDDADGSSPGQEGRMQSQREQPDWYKYTLDLPMARDPGGEHAIYCSASLNLVGGAVRNATRKWLPDFFEEYLARPLQIRSYAMNLMPTGEAYMGGGLYLRSRDELKLGQLYLSGGVWHGQRVVSEKWVKESTAHHSSFSPVTDIDVGHEYGYGWHIHHLTAAQGVFRDYYAGGNGGQYVIVIPDLDMVVGINGGSYGEAQKFFRWELEIVPQYLIPAALSRQRR